MIKFRIEQEKKENWKKLCLKREISLSRLIIGSVENNLLDDEKKEVLKFIEKQDNIFGKIETNINQVAKIANSQKFISENELKKFMEKLSEIQKLKEAQNKIFIKIYAMLGK